MLARIVADILVVVHLLFIVFVVFGGLLVLRWPRVVWAHVPCAVYGALIEFVGWVCPLTPLEQRLRIAAGGQGYASGFIDHYIMPLVYPPGLTRELQIWLGLGVLVINVGVYAWVVARWLRGRRRGDRGGRYRPI